MKSHALWYKSKTSKVQAGEGKGQSGQTCYHTKRFHLENVSIMKPVTGSDHKL